MEQAAAVKRLNALLKQTPVTSGKGVKEFPTPDDEMFRGEILRQNDWRPQTMDDNDCFRLLVVIASREAVPLTGVEISALDAETGEQVGQGGHLSVSERSPTEFIARVRLLPFGGTFLLQLSIPEEAED